jgi:acetyl-CoA carboxylase alpha subunit
MEHIRIRKEWPITLANHIIEELKALRKVSPEKRINKRIEKFSAMGRFEIKSKTDESR